MVIKEKFTLLRDKPNLFKISSSTIKPFIVEDGLATLTSILKLLEKKVDHFTKKKVFKTLEKGNIEVIYYPKYPLPITYNSTTKNIVINISPFSTREITPMNPSSRDLYGCLIYGICFAEIASKRYVIPNKYASVFSSFLLSVFFRVFGKEYGLIGIYSPKISQLKYLLNCYVFQSFFGLKGDKLFQSAAVGTGYDYKQDLDLVKKYDFSDIEDFIKALSETKVMPGIGKYNFVSKVLRYLSINFIPAIEDPARFVSVLLTSSTPGITPALMPAFYYRYNQTEFDKIMEISKQIFR